MPEGVFSMVHGASPEVGITLVTHPAIRAAAFTGSLVAGRTLYDAAALRPEPIPVFAEMGSSNPVFLLPGALAGARRGDREGPRGLGDARRRASSARTRGSSVVVDSPAANAFLKATGDLLAGAAAGTMVHAGHQGRVRPRASREAARIAGRRGRGARRRAPARTRRRRRRAALL